MFDSFRRERCALELYGKLPIAKDYLRIGCAQGTGLVWREWLDQTFSPARADSAAPVPAWPFHFIVDIDGDAPVMGTAWPSSDAGGRRRFPFTMFVERRGSALLEDMRSGLPIAGEVWRRLDDWRKQVDLESDPAACLQTLRGEQLRCVAPAAPAQRGIELNTWLDALWPDGRAGFEGVLRGVVELASQGSRAPLRFPLVSNLPLLGQVHAWLEVLRELGSLGADELPTLFFPHAGAARDDEGAAALYVVVARALPRPTQIALLTDPALALAEPGNFVDGQPRRSSAGGQPVTENIPPLADSLRGVLTSFRARAGLGSSRKGN